MLYEYRKQQFLRQYDILDEMAYASPTYYYPIPKKSDDDGPDYQGRFSYMPSNPHPGAAGILFENKVFAGLELIGLKGFYKENVLNGALWDIHFEKGKMWNTTLRNKYANIKNYNTSWVAGVGSLNHRLPWNTPNDKTDDELKNIIFKWIKETDFHKLFILKPISLEVEHSILHAVQAYQLTYLARLFSENNWQAAVLGPTYDVDLKRRNDGALYSFSIIKGRIPNVRTPAGPKPYNPRQLGLGKWEYPGTLTPGWFPEELGGDHQRFVYTEPMAAGKMGFFAGGKSIYQHRISLLQPGYDRAILHMRGQ